MEIGATRKTPHPGGRVPPPRRRAAPDPAAGAGRARPAALPARRLACGLTALLVVTGPLPAPARIAAAARGFTEGNRLVPGQRIDRWT